MSALRRPHPPANQDQEKIVSSDTELAIAILKSLPKDEQTSLLESLDVEKKKEMFAILMKR